MTAKWPRTSMIGRPGAVVTRAGTAITATAAADGTFRLADVPLAPGDNALTLTATDRAGNASTVTRTIAVEVPAAGRFAVAAADGTFALEGVPLAAGENAFEYTVTDVAGNTFEAAIRFTREPRPVVALGLAHDTARGGGTDADRVTADPTVAGAVTGAGWAVGLRAGFADVAGPLADVTAALAADGTFTLTPAMLQQLRGGPLAAGTYVLRVAATDTLGRESDPAELVFTLDTAPQIAVAAAVATGAGGRTAYQYTVTNPAANAGLRLGTFYLLVPAGAAPVDVVSPAGWSAEYLADSGLVLWAAGAAAADLPAGGSGVFGFTSPLPAGVIGFTTLAGTATGATALSGRTTGPAVVTATAADVAIVQAGGTGGTGGNRLPVAAPDAYSGGGLGLPSNRVFEVRSFADGLLANDSDPDGDPVRVEPKTGPAAAPAAERDPDRRRRLLLDRRGHRVGGRRPRVRRPRRRRRPGRPAAPGGRHRGEPVRGHVRRRPGHRHVPLRRPRRPRLAVRGRLRRRPVHLRRV
ncbi:MAG: hypothetical protein K2P78_05735 [Gemmataceae bacterium]|nr:hypothetical protein [Gemmataceae bacterium]